MNTSVQIEVLQEYARVRLAGEHSFRGAVERVKDAIRSCRDQRIRKLLVDSLDVRGFDPPTTIERLWMAEEIAEAVGGGAVKIAIVTRPEMVDKHKFGVMVSQLRGLEVDVFLSKEEALAWLLAP